MTSTPPGDAGNSLVLLGGGGHASDILAVVEARAVATNTQPNTIVIADDLWGHPERFAGRAVDVQRVLPLSDGIGLGPYIVAVGYPTPRRRIHDLAAGLGGIAAQPLVHPTASIGSSVLLGPGVVVMGHTWLSPHVRIGTHSHVGYGVTIGHDTRIGDFCSVMPGASVGGDVSVGDEVLIGAKATVLQGLSIGSEAVVGAGAVVTSDVAPGTTVVGVPARPLPRPSG